MKEITLEPGMISIKDAAERVGKSKRWLLDLVASGRLPVANAGNVFLVRPEDLKEIEVLKRGRPFKASSPDPPPKKKGKGSKQRKGAK